MRLVLTTNHERAVSVPEPPMASYRFALIFPLMLASIANAHAGTPPAPHDLWQSWTLGPGLLFGLTLTTWLYARGVRTLWRRAGVGAGISRLRAVAFGWGMIALFVALVSPLDALGSSLFSAHMVQHLLLTLAAAPLLVLSAPGYGALWAVPVQARKLAARSWKRAWALRGICSFFSRPLVAFFLYGGVLWVWHLPVLYQAALRSEAVHVIEHLTFLAAAWFFWSAVLGPLGRGGLSRGVGVLYLFGASIQGSALGVLIALAPQPWYPSYAPWTAAWSLTPLQDQQLAGLIMWMPAGMLYVVLASALVALWLKESERAEGPAGSRALGVVEGGS